MKLAGKIKFVNKWIVPIFVGLLFAGFITYAWNAVWHGTDWVQSGRIITPREIAENFEYLYQRAGKLPAGGCQNAGEVLQWDGSKFVCATVSGGSGTVACSNPSEQLLNGNSSYTVADCSAAGGTAVQTDDGCLCKFSGSSCPAGWAQYLNYSQTQSQTCNGSLPNCIGTSCSTGNHAFSNIPIETCPYVESWWAGEAIGCLSSNRTCYATITYVGCK